MNLYRKGTYVCVVQCLTVCNSMNLYRKGTYVCVVQCLTVSNISNVKYTCYY